MVLHRAVVPERDGVRLPAHTALELHGVRDLVEETAKEEVALPLVHVPEAVGETAVHVERVAPGERAQARVVVRVGQAAHVEYEIRVAGQATLEGEGLEQQGEPRAGEAGEGEHAGAQRRRAHPGGIDAMGRLDQGREQFAFARDAFLEGARTVGQRMAAARL